MSKFVKAADGTYLNLALVERLRLEKQDDAKVWTISALVRAGGKAGEWTLLHGEHNGHKDAEEAVRKLSK